VAAARTPDIPCEVIASGDLTRLEWYSGCRAEYAPTGLVATVFEVHDGGASSVPERRFIAALPGLAVSITTRPSAR
jgi:hypothetical protein